MIRVHAGPERNIRNAAGRTNLFFHAEQRDQLTKQGREPLTEVKDEITQILVIGSICLYDDGDAFRISQKEKNGHHFWAISSCICMVLAIYSGHQLIIQKKKPAAEMEEPSESGD